MSLIPEFELGLWNAWIFIIPIFVIPHLILSKYKARGSEEEGRYYDKKEKRFTSILMVTILASVIYSFFLPLKLGTAWFYVGLPIYLLGMIFLTVATLNFATTPLRKPVTKGVYRISRHPMDFGSFLVYISTGIVCTSWIFLLFAVIWIIVWHNIDSAEERWCLEKYGDSYREYINKTPKWIGMPKSSKKRILNKSYW